VPTTQDGAAVAAITVAGRTFRPVTRSTFAHQLYMMPLVRDAGLLGVPGQVRTASSPAEAEALLFRVIESRHTISLLAGVLAEGGREWSPEDADQNKLFFASLTDPRDCAALQAALLALVTDFFALAGSSPATSPASLSSTTATPAAPSRRRRKSEATTSSASGDTSSAPSPTTTPTRSSGSSTGRSAKG
jgi:hypothetical protein